MEKPFVHILPRICPRDGVTKLIKEFTEGVVTVRCPKCGYFKNQLGEEWFDNTGLYLLTPKKENSEDEKLCPLCNRKLLIHTESPRRRIVYCSNPECGYKNEFY